MNPNKALPVFLDERHHVALLAVVHIQFASGAGKNENVKVVEVFPIVLKFLLGEQFSVCAHHRVPQSAFLAHVVNGRHRC